MECSALGPLTYSFTWNDVLNGPNKDSCARQLAKERDGTWDSLFDCLVEASLMFNPVIVESLNFELVPRYAATRGAACRTNSMFGDAINAPLANITLTLGTVVCRQVSFAPLLQEEISLERLLSANYSLVAVVKFRAEAAPILRGSQPKTLSPFIAIIGRNQSAGCSDGMSGFRITMKLYGRQSRQLFF